MEVRGMFEIYVETIRSSVTGIIFLYLLWVDKREDLREWNGWLYILNGFFLLTFATVIDITDNFPSLGKYIFIGPTLYESFLEKITGYLLGSALLAIGFFGSCLSLRNCEGKQVKDPHSTLKCNK